MKKTIIEVFLVIAILIVAGIAVSIITGGGVWDSVLNAIAEPINNAWHSVTGSSSNLIDASNILNSAGVNDENDLGSVFD
jgi:hypothetical protein